MSAKTTTAAVPTPKVKKEFRSEFIIPIVSFGATLVMFIIATKGSFIKPSNIALIANIAFPTMIAALGAVFIYSHGGIDFSLGPVQGLSMMVIALIMNNSMKRLVPALICGVLISILCGVVLAILRTVLRLPALIASLCVQSIATGILRGVTMNRQVLLPVGISFLDKAPVKLGVLAAMVVLIVVVFEFTRIGKGNKAMGENITACALMGVNTAAMIFFAHILTNFAVGVSAIFSASQVSQIVATSGFGLEMDVLVAAVIGGMSLKGGSRSTILNILVGSLIVAMLTNGFSLWGVNPNIIMGIKGMLFLAVIFITRPRDKNVIVE